MRCNITRYCIHHCSDRAEYESEIKSTKDTPYLALTGDLWYDFCENFGDNCLCYNSTTLYVFGYYTFKVTAISPRGQWVKWVVPNQGDFQQQEGVTYTQIKPHNISYYHIVWCHCLTTNNTLTHWLLRDEDVIQKCIFIPPPNEVGGGVYWIHLVRPSVRLSVCL